MMRITALAVVVLAVSAEAQVAPTVNESTGELSITYPFRLPKARGRFQPTLTLSFSSSSSEDKGYGAGWTLSADYVERETRSSPSVSYLWLMRGTSKTILAAFNGKYRPETEDAFFEITPLGNGTYEARDASATLYRYTRVLGARAYLTEVADLDGNVVQFEYAPDREDATRIQYNSRISNPSSYSTTVDLLVDSSAVPAAPAVVASVLLQRSAHLTRVKVSNRGAVTHGYELSYTQPGPANTVSVASITEYGGDFARSLPATVFAYDVNGYSLNPQQGVLIRSNLVPNGGSGAWSWMDLNGDGLADLVWPRPAEKALYWSRNVSIPGALTPSFADPLYVPLPASCDERAELLDFDGDGIADVVQPSASGAEGIVHTIFRGQRVGTSFGVSTEGISLDVAHVYRKAPYSFPPGPQAAVFVDGAVLTDLNGDGVLDYARLVGGTTDCGPDRPPSSLPIPQEPCTWEYGLTKFYGSSAPVVGAAGLPDGTIDVAPGGAWFKRPHDMPPQTWVGMDLNGDGLTDAAWNRKLSELSSTGEWKATFNRGIPSGTAVDISRADSVSWNNGTLGGYASGVGHRLEWPDEYPTFNCPRSLVDDTRFIIGDLIDLNADGRPDFVRYGSVTWNTGADFANYSAIAGAPGHARYNLYVEGKEEGGNCGHPDDYEPCWCEWTLTSPYAGHYVDINGDRIPDFMRTSGQFDPNGARWFEWMKGVNASGVGGPLTLRMVTLPDGAAYSFEYAPAWWYGLPGSGRPVVTKLAIDGAYVSPNTTHYWYANPVQVKAWYDPARWDDRGFAHSWAQDDATRMVRYTTWNTGARPLLGRAVSVEVGFPAGRALGDTADSSGPGAPPGGITRVSREVFTFALKPISGGECRAPGEVSAGEYPIRVVPTRTEALSYFGSEFATSSMVTEIACGDVDAYGNVLKTVVTPAIASNSGPRLVTRAVHEGATQCKSVPGRLTVLREDALGNKLAEDVSTYDAACRLTSTYATGAGGNWTNLMTLTYGAPFYQRDTSTKGGVTTRTEYDTEAAQYVITETTEDALSALSTSYEYDGPTGLRTAVIGPRLIRRGGEPYASAQWVERYHYYDVFGRPVAVGKTRPALGTCQPNDPNRLVPCTAAIPNAIEAYAYGDGALPRSVTALRFAVARQLAPGALLPNEDDVARSVTYRDGLGRDIQVRERLGGGGGGAAAHVVRPLSGYKVAKAVIYDGAGRERVSLEPFYAQSEAFVDYTAVPVPPTRATVLTYDDQVTAFSHARRGVVWCSSYQYVSGSLPGPSQTCASDSSGTDSFRLATESRYSIQFVSLRGSFGGAFVAQESIPPELNRVGGPTGSRWTFADPAGAEVGREDGDGRYTWIIRDAMARERTSWRESESGTEATPEPASEIAYNAAGQVTFVWDANSGSLEKWSTYDDAGRLIRIEFRSAATGLPTGDKIEYSYEAGDLGRVTAVTQYQGDGNGNSKPGHVVARNHYDAPFHSGDPGYAYVVGKLSWTENGETVVVYGYDDGSRVARRDQLFAALPGGRFTVDSAYGTDGRVLSSRVVNPYGGNGMTYDVDYDSAGRPIALSGRLDSQTETTRFYEAIGSAPYGAYDALGRIATMRADDGHAVSARGYNPFSGALEAECKRLDTQLECFSSALDPARDLYRTTGAKYAGAKLEEYSEETNQTRYVNTYKPSGRLDSAEALPLGTVRNLTQDWIEDFEANGIGNLDEVTAHRNRATGSPRQFLRDRETYLPMETDGGKFLDQIDAVAKQTDTTGGELVVTETASAVTYAYDTLGHLTQVLRTSGESESLYYGPSGELAYRHVGERFVFYVGEYATLTAPAVYGGDAQVVPDTAGAELEAHVVFAGTRIASVKASRTLYYYRTRLGSVVATSVGGGQPGARYRYSPYGELEFAENDVEGVTRSELGYTNALRLTGQLTYLKTRVYDAAARVFIQPDSVDRLRYAYVVGDPANRSDPTGLLMVEDRALFVVEGVAMTGGAYLASSRGILLVDRTYVPRPSPAEQAERESARQREKGAALTNETPSAQEPLILVRLTTRDAEGNLVDGAVEESYRSGELVLIGPQTAGGPTEYKAYPIRSGSLDNARASGEAFPYKENPMNLGEYRVSTNAWNRSLGAKLENRGMIDERGFGYSFEVDPVAVLARDGVSGPHVKQDLLRIHPEAGRGTEGCIGVTRAHSQDFYVALMNLAHATGAKTVRMVVTP
jgi:RHS repeat-associated protein